MEKHAAAELGRRRFFAGRSLPPIDMDLPVEGGERREVIGARDLHPWQPVAALDGADMSRAGALDPVIDVGLRNRAIQSRRIGLNEKSRGSTAGTMSSRTNLAIGPLLVTAVKA